jgi:hypothetical protein
MQLYDIILLNVSDTSKPRVIKSDFVKGGTITTDYSRVVLDSTNNYFSLKNDSFSYVPSTSATYYFVHKTLLGDAKLSFNPSSKNALNLGASAPGTTFMSSIVDTSFSKSGSEVNVTVNNTNYENKDSILLEILPQRKLYLPRL